MKKKIISIIIFIVVIVLIILSIRFLRGGSVMRDIFSDMGNETENDSVSVRIQDGSPDDASKELAEYLTKQLQHEISAENVVSKGRIVRKAPFSYQVNSWEITKEPPMENGVLESSEVQLDDDGKIINDYSYIVVDLMVENLENVDLDEYVWGYVRLGIRGTEHIYVGEVNHIIYLETGHLKEKTKDTYKELFQANESKEIRLVYVVSDELLLNAKMYLTINSTGMSNETLNKGDVEVRRWIVLN